MLVVAVAAVNAIIDTIAIATGHHLPSWVVAMDSWWIVGFAVAFVVLRAELRAARRGRLTASEVIDQSTTPRGDDQLL
jgi:Na+-driven multidrug efflux pump